MWLSRSANVRLLSKFVKLNQRWPNRKQIPQLSHISQPMEKGRLSASARGSTRHHPFAEAGSLCARNRALKSSVQHALQQKVALWICTSRLFKHQADDVLLNHLERNCSRKTNSPVRTDRKFAKVEFMKEKL